MTPFELDTVRARFWRIGHISRFLRDPANMDHPAIMRVHVERSEHIEELKKLGYAVDSDEPTCPI